MGIRQHSSLTLARIKQVHLYSDRKWPFDRVIQGITPEF